MIINYSYACCELLECGTMFPGSVDFDNSSLFCVSTKNAVGLGQEVVGTVELAAAARGSDCLCPGFVLHITHTLTLSVQMWAV